MHPSNKITLDNVKSVFTYHRPTATTIPKYDAINAAALALAEAILTHAPDCADRAAAIRLVTQARMQANAAIACDPAPEPPAIVESPASA